MTRMHPGKSVVASASALLLALALGACGGSSRPAVPGAPSALVASAGNGQATLSWTAASGASGYNVYYATSAGVRKSNGTKVANVAGASTVVASLANDTTYFFVVTAFNSGGESGTSNEASAQPARGGFTQASLTGTWRLQALAAGASPGWMRGALDVAADGTVSIAPGSFLDDLGNATPAGLAPPAQLFVDAGGQVRDAATAASAVFTGIMGSQDQKKVVLTASVNGTQIFAVLLKHDPAVTFTAAGDINGFGGAAGGARRYAYSQIAAGASPQEWEFAQGQIGANNPPGGVQYAFTPQGTTTAQNYTLFASASSSIIRPGDKASILSVTGDGTVTEIVNTGATAVAPQPRFVMGAASGVMSDDKSIIVATTTDASTAGRFVLRIYQLINIGANDTAGGQPLSFALSDLGAPYGYRELAVGASALTASGTLTVDGTSGAATFTSYTDTAAGAAPPGFTLAVDQVNEPAGKQNGTLTSADASSVHGKLSDFKDMLVLTRTDAAGASRLTIALK